MTPNEQKALLEQLASQAPSKDEIAALSLEITSEVAELMATPPYDEDFRAWELFVLSAILGMRKGAELIGCQLPQEERRARRLFVTILVARQAVEARRRTPAGHTVRPN